MVYDGVPLATLSAGSEIFEVQFDTVGFIGRQAAGRTNLSTAMRALQRRFAPKRWRCDAVRRLSRKPVAAGRRLVRSMWSAA